MKILVVEDERDMSRIIVKQLQAENYTVEAVYDGQEALDYIEASTYDAVILDVMLPKLNGYEVLQRMRQQQNDTKVLLLTARDTIEDKIYGLDSGADDYLVKPFEFGELLARLRVLIRRNFGHSQNILQVDDLIVDTTKKSVTRAGKNVDLTAKEYSVLHYLIQNANHVLSRDQILNHVWDFDYEGESNIIDVIIKNIRKKISEANPEPIIFTKRGLGYVLQATQEN